jgi:two-component system sensor kinase FixL
MGEMAASLAHEVFNPLAAMVTNASAGQRLLAQGELGMEELRILLGDIVADGHRARQVVDGIRNMVRRGDASHSEVDVADVVRDLLRIVRADAVVRRIHLASEIDEQIGTVLGDRVQLLQVLLNLTLNAFDAVMVVQPGERRVSVRAERRSDDKVYVSVHDSGPGFPAGIAEHLFRAFFTTKPEGTGMGLTIARSIVDAHGGNLTAENSKEGGALFVVCLPGRRSK